MKLGIRLRLLLAVGSVVAAAVASVALLASRIIEVELEHYALGRPPDPGSRELMAAEVGKLYAASGSRRRANVLLRDLRRKHAPGRELLFVDQAGRVVATSSRPPPNVTIRPDREAGIELLVQTEGETSQVQVRGAETPVFADGRTVGRLHVLPPWRRRMDPMPQVNRGIAIAMALVGSLSLLVTALVARRILRPVEQLTTAARRMGRGETVAVIPEHGHGEVAELTRAFNVMAAKIAETERLRRNMVVDIAHELRTPLTGLRCSIEAIQDGVRPADLQTVAGLERQVTLLQLLVDDLQIISLAEARQLPLAPTKLSLRHEAEHATQTLPARVEVDVDPSLTVDADRERLQQILVNLLRNANTHTRSGRIGVKARSAPEALTITVWDTGDGIAPRDLPYVFDRFYRADTSRQRGTGGAGLGLAIVKNLVEAHGWRIRAESEPGRGSAFQITVPHT